MEAGRSAVCRVGEQTGDLEGPMLGFKSEAVCWQNFSGSGEVSLVLYSRLQLTGPPTLLWRAISLLKVHQVKW